MSTETIPEPVLEFHPAADLFPMMVGEEYEKLKADIGARGLIEPIWVYEGRILDGRNRYRACLDLGTQPRFVEYTGDSPTAFAWSLNGERRHLTKSQLATIAVNMLAPLKEEAKKRQDVISRNAPRNESGQFLRPQPLAPELAQAVKDRRAVTQAAHLVGVGKTTVQEAKALKEQNPELFAEVQAGRISVDKAAQISRGSYREPERNQPQEKRIAAIARLAAEGYRSEQISDQLRISANRVRVLARRGGIKLADETIGRTPHIEIHRVVESTVTGLEGFALGLQIIGDDKFPGVTVEEAREWAASLGQSLRALSRLRKQLLEFSHEQTA